MELSTITMFRFMEAMAKVAARLKDREECNRLLDAARADTPLVDSFLDDMAELYREPRSENNHIARVIADRSLLLVLTFREIAAEDVAQSARTTSSRLYVPPSQPRRH